MREIRNLYRLIPFGKFSLSGRGEAPYNQVFVGRQKERASFIEMLTHQEQFGAFLVSGQRGAGKSSFVRYCLDEYEANAFQRSLRSSRVSGLFELTFIGMILAAICLGFMLANQALHLFSQNVFQVLVNDPDFRSEPVSWTWVPLIVITLITVLPLSLFAIRGLIAAASVQGPGVLKTVKSMLLIVAAIAFALLPFMGWENFEPLTKLAGDSTVTTGRFGWLAMPNTLVEAFQFLLVFLVTYFALVRFMRTIVFNDLSWISNPSGQRFLLGVRGAFFLVSLVVATLVLQYFEHTNCLQYEHNVTKQRFTLLNDVYDRMCQDHVSSVYLGTAQVFRELLQLVGVLLVLWLIPFLILSATRFIRMRFGKDGAYWVTLYLIAVVIAALMAVIWAPYVTHKHEFGLSPLPLLFDWKDLEHSPYPPLLAATSIMTISFAIALWSGLAMSRRQLADGKGRPAVSGGKIWSFRSLLFAKSVMVLILAIALALPLLRVVIAAYALVGDGNFGHPAWSSALVIDFSRSYVTLHATLFLWLLLVGFYIIEWLWICRSQRAERADVATQMLGRAQDHEKRTGFWKKPAEASDTGATEPVSSPAKATVFHSLAKHLRRIPWSWPQYRGFPNAPITRTARGGEEPFHFGPRRDDHQWKVDRDGQGASSAHEQGQATHFQIRREVFRSIERCTLPWLLYSVRLPTIFVWVNLGFDNLAHSQIVEAMLQQLKSQYRKRFISPRGVVGGFNFLAFLITSLLATSILSKSLFHIEYNESLKYDPEVNIDVLSDQYNNDSYYYRFVGSDVRATPLFGQTNYCGFFEVYPELAPNIKSFLCGLPFANNIIEVAYAPLLQVNTDFEAIMFPAPDAAKTGEPDFRRIAELKVWPKLREHCQLEDRKGSPEPTWCGKLFASGLLMENADAKRPNVESKALFNSFLVRVIFDRNMGLPLLAWRNEQHLNQIQAYYPASEEDPNLRHQPPTLRTYHAALLLISMVLLYGLNRQLKVVPYRDKVRRIDDLLMSIKGQRITKVGANNTPRIFGFSVPWQSNEQTLHVDNDSRLVEQQFVELLHDLRPPHGGLGSRWTNWLEVRPEITFVFDEMDKLSGAPDVEASRDDQANSSVEENNRERQRSRQLHELLSDMKRLISEGCARFVFIGGRLYHDEWLADQAQRAPILNSIFNGQIYLPSLLSDRRHPYGQLNDRVAEFTFLMYRNAMHRMGVWTRARRSGVLGGTEEFSDPTYLQRELPYSGHPRRFVALAHHAGLRVINGEGTAPYADTARLELSDVERKAWPKIDREVGEAALLAVQKLTASEQETLEQFINFLTYRSAGNPKKLKELIQSLISPTSLGLHLPLYSQGHQAALRWGRLRHQGHDSIVLDDTAIYRVQFIDMLYRHLADFLEGSMLQRDDKVTMSLFYLMDFLLKFHNRGFSMTNLQRVDELSHIHRAPDLRSVMSTLVGMSSERFLHRVLNGVYAYRFRSDIAREIDYLSRISKEEMAALNFTLDESQSLKGLYQATINTGERANADTISGLGELYEYDQEYEIARNYYRRAIHELDQDIQATHVMNVALRPDEINRFRVQAGQAASPLFINNLEMTSDGSPLEGWQGSLINAIMTLEAPKLRPIVYSNFPWVTSRLRLMLQIGHSYEQEQNFERALANYMHAAHFSERVLDAMHSKEAWGQHKKQSRNQEVLTGDYPFAVVRSASQTLFYQAALAVAWVKEKDPESIDESIVYAHAWLQRIYNRDPLLEWYPVAYSSFDTTPRESGNNLVQVALNHDKAGDIYFLKGKVPLKENHTFRNLQGFDGKAKQVAGVIYTGRGYLAGAHYQYAMALWTMRRYLTLRTLRSGQALGVVLSERGEQAFNLRGDSALPDLARNTLNDILTDLSEAILAGQSSIRAMGGLVEQARDQRAQGSITKHPNSAAIKKFSVNLSLMNRLENRVFRVFLTGALDTTKPESMKFGRKWWRDIKIYLDSLWGSKANNEAKEKNFHNLTTPKAFFDEKTDQEGLPPLSLLEAGTYDDWLGQAFVETKRSNTTIPNRLEFETASRPAHRTMAYKFFSDAAINQLVASGQNTNAANELLLQAEALSGQLRSKSTLLQLAVQFKEMQENNSPGQDPLQAHRAHTADKALRKIAYFANPDYKKNEDAFEAILTALCQAYPKPNIGGAGAPAPGNKGAPIDPSAEISCAPDDVNNLLALIIFGSVLRSFEQFQISRRPSVTRMAKNRGNPLDMDESERGTKEEQEELKVDYDHSQAWRDDPRGLTITCGTLLSILTGELGCPSIEVALHGYKTILNRFDRQHFGDEVPTLLFKTKNGSVPSKATLWKTEPANPSDPIDLASVLKESRDYSRAVAAKVFYGLYQLLEAQRYPVLNRLNGLQILLTYAALDPEMAKLALRMQLHDQWSLANPMDEGAGSDESIEALYEQLIGGLARELIATSRSFASELHFPPHKPGQALALAYFVGLSKPLTAFTEAKPTHSKDRNPALGPKGFLTSKSLSDVLITRESLGETALNQLRRSEQLFSKGAAYYDNIGYLHFLNDDFNDRSIHFNHALGMMNFDMTALLISLIESSLFPESENLMDNEE